MDAKRSRLRRLRMTKREGERSFGMTLEQPKFRLHMHFPSVSYVSPQLPADRAGIKPGWIVRSVGSQCVKGFSVTEVASLFRGVVEVEIEIEDTSSMENSTASVTTTASLEEPVAQNSFDTFQARSAATGATASKNASAIPFSTVPSRAISNVPVNMVAKSTPLSSSAPTLPAYSAALMKSAVVSASLANMVTQSIQILGANTAAYAFASQSLPKPTATQLNQPMRTLAPVPTTQKTNQQQLQKPTAQPTPTPNPAPAPAPAPEARPIPGAKQPVTQLPMPTPMAAPEARPATLANQAFSQHSSSKAAPAPEARPALVLRQPAAFEPTPKAHTQMNKAPTPQTAQQPGAQYPTPAPPTDMTQPTKVSKASAVPQVSQVEKPAQMAAPKIPTVVQPVATLKPAIEPTKYQPMKQLAPVPKMAASAPAQSIAQRTQPAPSPSQPKSQVPSTQHHKNGLATSSHLHASQKREHQSATPNQETPVQRTVKENGEKMPTQHMTAAAHGVKSPQRASAMMNQSAVATRLLSTASPSTTAHCSTVSVEPTNEHKGSNKRSRRESVDTTTPRPQSKQARYRRNYVDDSSELEDVPDEEGVETRGRSRRSRRLASETGRQRQSVVVQRLITSGFTEEDAQASVNACGHDQEKCMIWIISLMEEREFTKQLNMASIESEQSKRNEEKELKKIESETLKKATAFASLFPTSYILQRDTGCANFKTLVQTTMGAVNGDCLMRVLFTKLLKLESQAIRWYKDSAKCYMLQMAERLEAALGSHDVVSCCAEVKSVGQCGFVKALQEEEQLLTKTLFDMPENHGGVPVLFLQADKAMQFSLENDGFEVIDHVDETLVD